MFGTHLGAVFENNTFYNEGIAMLQYAAAEANDKILPNSGMELAIEVQTIAYGREYAVSKRVCSLLEVIKSGRNVKSLRDKLK